MLKVKQIFLKYFYEYFHDSLNIVVVLTPDCEFFSANCPLTFKE